MNDSPDAREALPQLPDETATAIVRLAYELGRAHGLAEGLQRRITDLEAKVNGS